MPGANMVDTVENGSVAVPPARLYEARRIQTVIEPLLLTTARVSTFFGRQPLTGASGFFFERDERLFFVTSRHVVFDLPSQHFPNRIEIEVHSDARNLTRAVTLSVLLYRDGMSVWHQGSDAGGEIDVAVIEIQRSALPESAMLRCFRPAQLQGSLQEVEVGNSLLIVGFPLGFHDTLHHLPVVRQAVIASSFGLRFQGQGYFLTDARTHRGTSGAPVVMRDPAGDPQLPWKLLGVHSIRMDMVSRDRHQDESLGLNCVWYADILLTLTAGDTRIAMPEQLKGATLPADGE
jgi:S1-C subfamily serine protease